MHPLQFTSLCRYFAPRSSSAAKMSALCAARACAPPQPRPPTKIVLPNKKPQKWSTGTGPGEYGGPPASSELRKYWGGRSDEDPVEAVDDFIWNKDFAPRMRRLFLRSAAPEPPVLPPKEPDSGFLSISRAMSLDSVEIDLSKELQPPSKPVLEQQVEAARRGRSITNEASSSSASPRWRFVPTRGEQKRWDRANKTATSGTDVLLRESRRDRGDPKILAAKSREQYFKLKQRLQLLTLGIGGVGVVSAYVSYSPEVAVSFSAGLLGSLVYVRMLGNSVDSLADGARGLIKGAAGQPRLLVPALLVMVFNRWNELVVPDYGVMPLQLVPMLVGFFTYKVATFAQTIQDAVFYTEKP